jgi:GT2 family glycosyltransferase
MVFSTENGPNSSVTGHVSVIIVTWNHAHYLPHCLGAITNQSYTKVDITVVDNASQDGSAEWISFNTPQIRLIRLNSNQGFSKAFNLGARTSNGEFVLSLNPDVKARPDFLSKMILEAQKDATIGIAAPKLLRADDPHKLDSTGLFINHQRRPYDRGQMESDSGQYDTRTEVFGACGAAALFRRAMLDDLAWEGEFFDEDFFAYYEDIDLAWRARLRGWHSIYVPGAVAEHARGWGDTLRKNPRNEYGVGPRLALRNRYLMVIKNDSVQSFLLDAPLIFLAEIPRLFYMVFFNRDALAGIVDFFRLAPKAREKRKIIQSQRTVNDYELRGWFTRND